MRLQLEMMRVSKSYNGRPVLHDCSFSFDGAGPYVLMGPNGCGKSTLFRICALIEEPDSGEIIYRSGNTVREKNLDLRRRITLVLPRIGVFNTSAFNNVAYGLRVRGLDRRESADRVQRTLEFVGLQDKAKQNALTLSSGETQKLGIARALVIEPDILFLDEPTAFIDAKSKVMVEEIILRIRESGRTLVIITTHDRGQAERLGRCLLQMNDGRIVA